MTTRCPSLPSSTNWTPAFAGVVAGLRGGVLAMHLELFPREGGDPVWAPAFAGEQGGAVLGKRVADAQRALHSGGGVTQGIIRSILPA
ncbi:hypothetical protein J3A66_001551 [Sphingomonas sp. PvP018]|nr:hypothetical protein [Sphingomonas sp. PvP018]